MWPVSPLFICADKSCSTQKAKPAVQSVLERSFGAAYETRARLACMQGLFAFLHAVTSSYGCHVKLFKAQLSPSLLPN